jgi:hypothetical protein
MCKPAAALLRAEVERVLHYLREEKADLLVLNSARSQAHANLSNTMASLLKARLNLSLAEADVKRIIGQTPR